MPETGTGDAARLPGGRRGPLPPAPEGTGRGLALDSELAARISALELKARYIVEGFLAGAHRSPYRGFSVEFAQHRPYLPGDEIRRIDWKVYGRSGRYHVKQYEEYTNLTLTVLLDTSESMAYGEGEQRKIDYARLLGMCLAHVVVAGKDAVSLVCFADGEREHVPPTRSLGMLRNLALAMQRCEPAGGSRLEGQAHVLAERLSKRGIIAVISDFLEGLEGIRSGLQHLAFKGHEVILFHVLHRDELEFPFHGFRRFIGLEALGEVKCRPHLLRRAFVERMARFREQLAALAEACRSDYVPLVSDLALWHALRAYFYLRTFRR